jgi:hypothetical protein
MTIRSARRRVGPFVLLCVVTALALAGCASIPGETLPQRADLQGGASGASAAVPQPPKNEGALNIVRDFVNNSGDPSNLHAAARGYLAKSAQSTWNQGSTPPSVTIIDDLFDTIYGATQSTDSNLETVVLHAHLMGSLGRDGAFQPPTAAQAQDYQLPIQVRRQADGQWRIVNPPDSLLIIDTAFDKYYRPVSVYFFDDSWDTLVPDPRYVVSDPASGLAGRIVELLLGGPSDALKGSVQNAIPDDASLKTNVLASSNGEIVVNLKAMPDQTSNVKQLMVAQIVRSLENYGSSVAVQSEGVAVVPGHVTWRLSDLPSYSPFVGANATGLVVSHGKVLNLASGAPIHGPAGDGDHQVVTAAESLDGQELATVTRETNGTEMLRVGGLKSSNESVKDLNATTFTRPTWMPGDAAGDPSRSVWTVAGGVVVRVVSTPQGTWAASPVDASALATFGPITDLRLSRDGVRVAVVAGGHLYVGAVVSDQGSVAIKQVRLLQPTLVGAVRVDWLRQDLLVVATTQAGSPVRSVSVDGETMSGYSSANLTTAITEIAAGESGPVLAVDAAGIWSSPDINEVWQPMPHNQSADAVPFYPG